MDALVEVHDAEEYQKIRHLPFPVLGVNNRAVYTDRTGAAWQTEFNAAGNPTARVDPVGLLRQLDRAIIDEVQRAPELLLALKLSIVESTRKNPSGTLTEVAENRWIKLDMWQKLVFYQCSSKHPACGSKEGDCFTGTRENSKNRQPFTQKS